MRDPHLHTLVEKARERLAQPGAPLESTSLRVWNPTEVDRFTAFAAKADVGFAHADAQLRSLAADPDLSESAKQRKRSEVLARLRDHLGTLERDVDAVGREVATLTERAPRLQLDGRGHFVERGRDTSPTAELRRQEVRALLRSLPEPEREARILAAVVARDRDVIEALDGPASTTFPLVSDETQRRLSDALVAASPAYPHVLSLRQLASFSGMALSRVRHRLAEFEQSTPHHTHTVGDSSRS